MKLSAALTTGVVVSIAALVASRGSQDEPTPAGTTTASTGTGAPPGGPSGAGGAGGGPDAPATSTTTTGGGEGGTTPATGPIGPNDPVAPWPFARREEVQSWSVDDRNPALRHTRIMALARAGALDPVRWVWVPVRGGLEVQVSSDGVSYGGIRLCCSVYTAQQVADVIGAMLCTPAIVRAAHRAARVKIPAQSSLFFKDPGGPVAAWLRHQDAIMRAAKLAAWDGAQLLSTVGKDYVLCQYVVDKPHNSPIYGWSFPTAELSGPAGEQVPMIQSPRSGCGSPHGPPGDDGLAFFDYSHSVRVVHPMARLNGAPVELASIYRERSELVSHLGNRELIPARHPAVPPASISGV